MNGSKGMSGISQQKFWKNLNFSSSSVGDSSTLTDYLDIGDGILLRTTVQVGAALSTSMVELYGKAVVDGKIVKRAPITVSGSTGGSPPKKAPPKKKATTKKGK